MPRALLLVLLIALTSSVRADEVSEAALAGRWKVVGTAPTAKNRDGLAELEKHGCYLYFEFAANGRAAVGIGSDSKAKLEALKKANSGVELEWNAKFEVANGRVEISGFPARLREPGGWLGDSATAIFRARLDGDTLELTGPGGFVAFQKVKKPIANGATGTKANPKADANPLLGRWIVHKHSWSPKTNFGKIGQLANPYYFIEFGPDGVLVAGAHADAPLSIHPSFSRKPANYRLGPGAALETSNVDPAVTGLRSWGLSDGKFTYAIDREVLTITSADEKRWMTFWRLTPMNAFTGTWRLTKSTRITGAAAEALEKAGTKILCVFDKDGGVTMEVRLNGGLQPAPASAPPGQNYTWKYRVVSNTELEFYDVPAHLRGPTGPAGGSSKGTLGYKLDGDTLELTETDGKNTLTYAREK